MNDPSNYDITLGEVGLDIWTSVLKYLGHIRCDSKKVSKFRLKFYSAKICPIWFKLRLFVDKVSDKNMVKFQQNQTTFY